MICVAIRLREGFGEAGAKGMFAKRSKMLNVSQSVLPSDLYATIRPASRCS